MEAVDAAGAVMFSTLTAGVDTEAPTLVFTYGAQEPGSVWRESSRCELRMKAVPAFMKMTPEWGDSRSAMRTKPLCGPDIRTMGEDKGSNTESHSRDRRLQEQLCGPYHDHWCRWFISLGRYGRF